MFFVATAPLAADGLLNCSPKGLGGLTLRARPAHGRLRGLHRQRRRTIAHVRENGRIVVMLCAFSGAPRIPASVRPRRSRDAAFAEVGRPFGRFELGPGARAIVLAHLTRIADSCGWGVPVFEEQTSDRDTLRRWAESKGDDGVKAYRAEEESRVPRRPAGVDPVGRPVQRERASRSMRDDAVEHARVEQRRSTVSATPSARIAPTLSDPPSARARFASSPDHGAVSTVTATAPSPCSPRATSTNVSTSAEPHEGQVDDRDAPAPAAAGGRGRERFGFGGRVLFGHGRSGLRWDHGDSRGATLADDPGADTFLTPFRIFFASSSKPTHLWCRCRYAVPRTTTHGRACARRAPTSYRR